MIRDLFSHKIHSSGLDWPDKLVEIAAVFSEFDGELYDRQAIEKRLLEISPRAALAPRDASKFRDEISAYPAYLGLYHLFQSPKGWVVSLSRTARSLLVKEEPDVAGFMRLQLTLFQYPNGMGAAYQSFSNRVRIQANARDRMLEFVSNGIHLSPVRLITAALEADSKIRGVGIFFSSVTYAEVFGLANDPRTNRSALPDPEKTTEVLREIRQGTVVIPDRFESRFHILKHTDLFSLGRQSLSFRSPVDSKDRNDLLSKITAIRSTKLQFDGFDEATSGEDLEKVIGTGDWGKYFDGLDTLKSGIADALRIDIIETPEYRPAETVTPSVYTLSERKRYSPPSSVTTRGRELADPEATRIKRQKRNLAHKLLIDRMSGYLTKLRAIPKDNPHIDLYAEIPDDGSFLFEMKSGGENVLDQIRKGLSQLYEYQFRYKEIIRDKTNLCLVLNEEPTQMSWIIDFLCNDRGICLCWFDNTGQLKYPDQCKTQMEMMPTA